MYEYLKNKGMGNMSEHEFMDKFREFMDKGGRYFRNRGWNSDYEPMEYSYRRGYNEDPYVYYRHRYHSDYDENEHITDSEAIDIVSRMHHSEGGRVLSGEKFTMSKARELKEKYKGMLPMSVTLGDIYVAINAQYHCYAELFKSWFGEDINQKIVESAIVFWFKGDNFRIGNKVMKHLRNY